MRPVEDLRWQRFRFALGTAQMSGASIAFGLLLTTGVTRVTVFAAVLTTLLTAIGVLARELRARR